jgi:hypothetical protein
MVDEPGHESLMQGILMLRYGITSVPLLRESSATLPFSSPIRDAIHNIAFASDQFFPLARNGRGDWPMTFLKSREK